MIFSLKFYTQPNHQSSVRIKKNSELKVSKDFSHASFLRKLFENVINENERINKRKRKQEIQETRSNTGESKEISRIMMGSSRTIVAQLAQKATGQLEQDEAGKLSGKLSDTFNYMYSHIKKPSIRIKKFKQRGGKKGNY